MSEPTSDFVEAAGLFRQPDHPDRTFAPSDLSFVTEWAMSPAADDDAADDVALAVRPDPSPSAHLGAE